MANKAEKPIEIQPLPKRLYKKVYGDDLADNWQFRYSGLLESEKSAVKALMEAHQFKHISWIPEVDYPNGIKTPDLLIDGRKVEIKQISSVRSAREQIHKGVKQIDSDGWMILDVSKSEVSTEELLNVVEDRGALENLSRFALVQNEKVIAYKHLSTPNKKGDLGTTSFAGRDARLTYVDIVPDIIKKSTDEASIPVVGGFSPRKRTNAYWAKRSEGRLVESERLTKPYMAKIRKAYDEAMRANVNSLKSMYAAYYKGKDGFDMQALNAIAPSGDIARFREEMRKAGLSTYLPDNYKGRVSRLELLNAQMWSEVKKAAIKHTGLETAAHAKVIDNAFYKTAYDISKGIGGTPSTFSTLNTRTINNILSSKFEGKNFSKRIWGNTDILAKQLQEKLAVAIATGQPIEKTSREFRERFGVQKYYADRLIRTETNYFHNASAIESYRSMGIEEFKFSATLDIRTSAICQSMDGKIFKVKDAIPGENCPPLHPNCRSAVVPYVKGYEPERRIARNPTTNKNMYVSNMTYPEWRRSLTKDVVTAIGDKDGVIKNNMLTTAYGVTYDLLSLVGIHPQVISDYADQAKLLMNKYPEVEQWAESQGEMVVSGADLGNQGTLAAASRLYPSVKINPRYHQSADKLMRIMRNGIKSGHFMPASRLRRYVFSHEFGHNIENYLIKRDGLKPDKVRDEILNIAVSKYNMTRKQAESKQSKYATQSSREFFAECFANMMSGKRNALGNAMELYLRSKLK
ncbi:MAG: minor capsid protein [Candidatus Saccharibacteria bacterium]|nr:minor capsid protein [Candidatus Saccharibacteria bacterium]